MSTALPDAAAQADPGEPLLPLLELASGAPSPVDSLPALRDAVERLAAATGPVAIDAERASGYRYGQRCYLVQIRREGAGTILIDPIACPDLHAVDDALAGAEWVVHAASQDLPCLDEVGLRPRRLFDTELAARLAGYERVGLATMVERVLGCRLEKGHSAADWSQRPLTAPLLRYAALDVEPLLALRDHLETELREQGKWDWALEEFAAVAATGAMPPQPRAEPWRRTSGLHRVRTPRQLAGVRAMWELRDEIARRRDLAPSRVLPDAAIIDAVLRAPASAADLAEIPPFSGRVTRRSVDRWFGALQQAAALPAAELPRFGGGRGEVEGPPPTNRWNEREPAAAARLVRLRAAVAELAERHALPVENLVEPAIVRRLAWTPPDATHQAVAEAMRSFGARDWQVGLAAAALAGALLG